MVWGNNVHFRREVCSQAERSRFTRLIPQAYDPTVKLHTTMRSSGKDALDVSTDFHMLTSKGFDATWVLNNTSAA